jgi:hypothetical protein
LGELRIPTSLFGHALKKVIRVVADRQGRELMEVGKEAGAEVVCGTSLKAALDQDWDQLGQREEALSLVLKVLQVVETWVQTLQRDEVELGGTLEIARQVEAQDVQADEQGKVSLIDFLTDALWASAKRSGARINTPCPSPIYRQMACRCPPQADKSAVRQ